MILDLTCLTTSLDSLFEEEEDVVVLFLLPPQHPPSLDDVLPLLLLLVVLLLVLVMVLTLLIFGAIRHTTRTIISLPAPWWKRVIWKLVTGRQ